MKACTSQKEVIVSSQGKETEAMEYLFESFNSFLSLQTPSHFGLAKKIKYKKRKTRIEAALLLKNVFF